MTFQGDPNRPPLQDDPNRLPPEAPLVQDRGFSVLPILAAAALVLVLGYLFLGPSGDTVGVPTSDTGTRIERPAVAPAPATTPGASQTTPAQKPPN